MSDVVNLA